MPGILRGRADGPEQARDDEHAPVARTRKSRHVPSLADAAAAASAPISMILTIRSLVGIHQHVSSTRPRLPSLCGSVRGLVGDKEVHDGRGSEANKQTDAHHESDTSDGDGAGRSPRSADVVDECSPNQPR
jgi:hypothetical protein